MKYYQRYLKRLTPLAEKHGYSIEIEQRTAPYRNDNLILRPKNKDRSIWRFDNKEMGINFVKAQSELLKLEK